MKEVPDFVAITASILDTYGYGQDYGEHGLREEIIDQLRAVWNARGVADLSVFDALSTLSRDHREIVRDEFARDLGGLDR